MNRIEMLNFFLTQFSASALLSDILGEMSNKDFMRHMERIAGLWGINLPCDCGVHGLEGICCKKEEHEALHDGDPNTEWVLKDKQYVLQTSDERANECKNCCAVATLNQGLCSHCRA